MSAQHAEPPDPVALPSAVQPFPAGSSFEREYESTTTARGSEPHAQATAPSGQPALGRMTSRLPDLSHIRSIEAHPPAQHHAHFDESSPGTETPVLHSPPKRGKSKRQGGRRSAGSGGAGAGGGHGKPVIDIEHVPVEDDPRDWSNAKKNVVLAMLTISVLGPLIAPSVYNPVIDDIRADLSATQTEIGLSLSMYIAFQGIIPLLWAPIAEVIGRKPVYLLSYAIYFVGCLVGARANSMVLFIIMRCVAATGSAAVVAVGAGSLADVYEVHERGQKLGIFYGMPLLGPSLGPLIGGALGNAFGWRASFYFLTAYAAVCLVMFLFFPDTWRKERSRVYQKAMEQAVRRALHHDEVKERKRQKKIAKGLASSAATPATTTPGTPVRRDSEKHESVASAAASMSQSASTAVGEPGATGTVQVKVDAEKGEVTVKRKWWNTFGGLRKARTPQEEEEHEKIRPSLRDVNPFPPMVYIFHSPTNALILVCSGFLFAAQYTITYTASITLSREPYGYNALYIGLVILSFGVGNIIGSIGGGKYSDYILKRLKKRNGGVSTPEMRLKGVIPAMPLLVGSFLTYAWTAGEKVNIAGIIISLFFGGLSLMIIYSSTLAYLVDANPGRSASAIACNSFVRGSFACILSQTALPIQNAIGDGGLFSLFAGLLAFSSAGMTLIAFRGQQWRDPDHRWPWQKREDDEDEEEEEVEEDGTLPDPDGAGQVGQAGDSANRSLTPGNPPILAEKRL